MIIKIIIDSNGCIEPNYKECNILTGYHFNIKLMFVVLSIPASIHCLYWLLYTFSQYHMNPI